MKSAKYRRRKRKEGLPVFVSEQISSFKEDSCPVYRGHCLPLGFHFKRICSSLLQNVCVSLMKGTQYVFVIRANQLLFNISCTELEEL
jgi:hypothetical protein